MGLVGRTVGAVANILVAKKSTGLAITRPEFNPNVATTELCNFRPAHAPLWASVSPPVKPVGEVKELDKISRRFQASFLPRHTGSCGVCHSGVGREYNLNLSSPWRGTKYKGGWVNPKTASNGRPPLPAALWDRYLSSR